MTSWTGYGVEFEEASGDEWDGDSVVVLDEAGDRQLGSQTASSFFRQQSQPNGMHRFGKDAEFAELVRLKGAADDSVFSRLNRSYLGDAAPPSIVFAVDHDISGANGPNTLPIAVYEFEMHVQGVIVRFEQQADGCLPYYLDGELGIGRVCRTVSITTSGVFLPSTKYACVARIALGRFL